MRNMQQSSMPVVLSVAFPYATIGRCAVGGAEVVCTQVESALGQMGYLSVVVAREGSTPHGRLYGTHVPDATITNTVREQVERSHQAGLDRACAENPVALLHMHGLDFHRYRVPEHLPIVVTLHLPPSWYPKKIWDLPENYHLVCVSEHQRRQCPAHVQHRVRVVENGVPLPSEGMLRDKGKYALMLARICPEKNLHVGIDAAQKAGLPVMLGGEVFPYPEHQRYFDEEIAPRLTSSGPSHEARSDAASDLPNVRFLGPVSGEEKVRLLSRAACLLLPSLAPETSSMVAMEALAAGVPVIAMAVGAVPEIVEDGRTGFLVNPGESAAEEIAQAIGRLPELDRRTCRAVAEERFPLPRMLEGYARLYDELLAQTNTSSEPEPTCEEAAAQKAAAFSTAEIRAENMTLEPLTNTNALLCLAEEWTGLWSSDPHATPFQHPAWLLPWWRQFGPDGELQALVVRERSSRELLALLPTYVYLQPDTQLRQLLLMGAGTTDYLDGIWKDGSQTTAEVALAHLLREREQWDTFTLHQLRAGSRLVTAGTTLGLNLSHAEPCATLDLQKPLPSKIRLNLNRFRRRAEAQGPLCCELCDSPDEVLATFRSLVAFHAQRWRNKGETAVLSDERVLAHHQESLPLLAAAGLLRLFRLSLAGEVIGVLYGLADASHVSERRLYLYLVGFDERFADVSPGSLLLHEAWLHAQRNGFRKVDLLRGGETYKQLWGAGFEPTFAIELG